ncbi:MAG: hypothetical protein WCB27_10275 [Thermoguttaceae bacterium]
MVAVALTLLVVLPLRVRAKTPPGGPSNTGVWVQTRPPQYWTSASCECDAYGNFEYDGEGWPPVQGPTFGAAKVASASVSGANAQADSTALLAVNPAGQTVMQSMFTLTDSVIGNVTEDEYGYYVTAATAGTLSVQGTLSTSAPDVLAQARVDIVWGGGFGGDDSADRHVDIAISFGGSTLTVADGGTGGLVFASGTDGNGNSFARASSTPIDGANGKLAVNLGEFVGYVPNGTPGSITVTTVSDALAALGPPSLTAGSEFYGTLELWAGSPPSPPPPAQPLPPPSPPPAPAPAP